MNKNQSNKYNSYIALKGVLTANAGIYEPVPVLKQLVELFLNLFAQLIQLNTENTVDTSGVTDSKIQAKDKMAKLASELASAAMAWAHEQNDPALQSMFDHSYSDIRFARDNQAASTAASILGGLKQYSSSLSSYLIEEQDIATLETEINEFTDKSETKGAIKSNAVSETRKMSELFSGIDDLLTKKLDKLMQRMESKEPDFYAAYKNARTIIDL